MTCTRSHISVRRTCHRTACPHMAFGRSPVCSVYRTREAWLYPASCGHRISRSLICGGQGILIGFIDTGIDYTHQRSVIQMEIRGFFQFGIRQFRVRIRRKGFSTERSIPGEQINEALRTADPFALVPTRDEDGTEPLPPELQPGVRRPMAFHRGSAGSISGSGKTKDGEAAPAGYYFSPGGHCGLSGNGYHDECSFPFKFTEKATAADGAVPGTGTNTGGHDAMRR